MIRNFFLKVEEWMDDDSFLLSIFKFCFVFILVGCVIMFPFFMISKYDPKTEYKKCLDSGRGWAIVGKHETTNMVWVGRVLMPRTTTTTEYGCFDIKR